MLHPDRKRGRLIPLLPLRLKSNILKIAYRECPAVRLATYTDYSLRRLMYAALKGSELAAVHEVADAYGVSKNHLVKIAYNLGLYGYLETVRRHGGGLRLARAPEEISLGQVIRRLEEDFAQVECLRPRRECRIAPARQLRDILSEALSANLAVLDKYSLADLVDRRAGLTKMLLASRTA